MQESYVASLSTVGEALHWSRQQLRSTRTGSLDAHVLLAHVLEQPRSWVVAHPEAEVTPQQAEDFRVLIERRVHGEPVAYLRGWVEWYGLELAVTSDVLVPRPDTEVVLEEAIALARRLDARVVADVGTGSGAIAIGMARVLPNVRVVAVDRSAAALAVASGNAIRQRVADRILFLEGSLLEPVASRPDLIVANLPYLSDNMMAELDIDVRYEPEVALYGGASGLELYEEMFEQMARRDWMVPVVFEIDPREAEAAVELAKRFFADAAVRIAPDLAGLDRAVVVEPAHE